MSTSPIRRRSCGALFWLVLLWLGASGVVAAREPAQVAFIIDGPEERAAVSVFADALSALIGGDTPLEGGGQVFAGDWTAAGIEEAADRAYAAGPDLVVAVGLGASAQVLSRGSAPISTIAPLVLDPVGQRVVKDAPAGVYPVRVHLGLSRDMELFAELVGAQRLAILAEASLVELLGRGGGQLPAILVPVAGDADAALAALPEGVDGVIVTPMARLGEEGHRALAAGLASRGVPSFTLGGLDSVGLGYLASYEGSGELEPVARRAALIGAALLRKEAPPNSSWSSRAQGALILNGPVMEALDVSPPFDTLIEARVIGDPASAGDVESLEQVIALALESSPALASQRAAVEAARSDVIRAWSNWLPQVDLSGTLALVDADLARASLGQTAPASVTANLGLTQVIYSEQARALIPINERLQAARVAEFDALSLDLAAEVGKGYVDVLRARALLSVRQSDVNQVRANLDAARMRVAVGDATEAELARWESELAMARAAVVDAYVAVNAARLRVNQLIGRPTDTRFVPDSGDADALIERTEHSALGAGLGDPRSLRALTEALVRIGLEDAPEMAQIELGLASQSEWARVTRRTYFIPTVAASAGATWNAWRPEGEGGLDLSALGVMLPTAPDLYWTAGVKVSLPLFSGRSRDADRFEAQHTLASLTEQRAQVSQLLELRIRAAMLSLEGTYQSARLSAASVAGAERNLSLVKEAYAQGLVTQVQLLDARSAWLLARLGEADSRYEYLAAMIELRRAVVQLRHPTDQTSLEAFSERVRALIEEDEP